ncbi:uncharacterized protein LOC143017543 [Oratosquilla oratoria]|uniref:uncharacterized protein LOC143017543 n=1 Tax=Oratosquilla oratoria TaxID=337810 RepID=UPI003F763A5A
MTIAKQNISPTDGVYISYCLDGNLFNLQRLQSKTLVTMEPLKNIEKFTYLGSVLSSTNDLTSEMQRQIGLASASFGRLSYRVFMNRDLTSTTKISVYKVICLSILLYRSESWVLYRRHLKKLEAFHTNCLQCILGVKWWHRVLHAEIHSRAHVNPIETIISQRQLRWLGHTIRMPTDRFPLQDTL